MSYRTWLNLLLAVALFAALGVLANRADDTPGIVIEARDPPRSAPIGGVH